MIFHDLTIEEIKQKNIPIAQEYGGSYACDEDGDDSDLDFLIDCGDISGLLHLYNC